VSKKAPIQYPVTCDSCGTQVDKPSKHVKGAILRPIPYMRKSGRLSFRCSNCAPKRPFSDAFLRHYGDVTVNGWPVGKDKRITSLEKAVGWKRSNGEGGWKYVRRK
jgi:hypothetical protein